MSFCNCNPCASLCNCISCSNVAFSVLISCLNIQSDCFSFCNSCHAVPLPPCCSSGSTSGDDDDDSVALGSPPDSGGSDDGLSAGAIVGIVLGVLVLLLIVAGAVIFFARKSSPQDTDTESTPKAPKKANNVAKANKTKKMIESKDQTLHVELAASNPKAPVKVAFVSHHLRGIAEMK